MSKIDENLYVDSTTGITNLSGGITSYTNTILNKTTKYYILGEYVEFKSMPYSNELIILMISSLNVLGKPYYDSLIKNGDSFQEK